MMGNRISQLRGSRRVRWPVLALILLATVLLIAKPTYGAELPDRRLLLSDNNPNATSTYMLGFTILAPEMLGSIELQICANSPLHDDPCTVPSGFDVSVAALSAQTGETGFTISPATTANDLILTRAPALSTVSAVTYTLSGVLNPDSGGAYYGRLKTFPTNDASGTENDFGGIAFSINNLVQVSTTVPPFLLFCGAVTISGSDCTNASGNYINFGNLTTGSTASASSQLLTATNAGSGLNISVFGQTMTSGNNVISAVAVQDVSRPGTEQFGLNLVANVVPLVGANPQGPGNVAPLAGYNTANSYKFVSGDQIASTSGVDDWRKLTASYIINIPAGQAVGVYSTTLTYVCLANF